MLVRAALGNPGRPQIEVGISEPRFAEPRGRPTDPEELALRRALGGVAYPAGRERLVAEAGRWLASHPGLRDRLRDLPELTYGGELEVLRRLSDSEAEIPERGPAGREDGTLPSAGIGNQEGSSASR
jgi:hypothetical protein